MAYSNCPDSKDVEASVKIPDTFLPPTQTSFTHLICASSPLIFSRAFATATAAAVVKSSPSL